VHVKSYSYIERNGFFSMGSRNPPCHLIKIMSSRHLSRVKYSCRVSVTRVLFLFLSFLDRIYFGNFRWCVISSTVDLFETVW